MAIYRLERKSISRGNNHNLVAAVAYRAGLKLADNNELNPKATTHDYTKKTDVAHSEIVLPVELSEQIADAGITFNFEEIANLVERGETTLRGKMKMSAKLANEYVLAGSHELSQAENIKAFQEFAKCQAEEQNVIVMIFVHDPKHGDDMSANAQAADSIKSKDLRNIHAHVVALSRQVNVKNGELTLGKKSDSELSNDERTRPVVPEYLVGTFDPNTKHKIQQGRGLCSNSDWLKGVRKQWADIQNRSLEQYNIALVTHKSYKDLGLKFKPTIHLGKNANHLERIGIQTELGKYNESVNEHNHAHLEYAAERLTISAKEAVNLSEQWANSVSSGIGEVMRGIGKRKQRTSAENRVASRQDRTARPRPNDASDFYASRARARKQRARIREQRAYELNESASTFNRETDDYYYEFETATEQMIKEVIYEFLTRSAEKFDVRQLKILDDFAQKNKLTLEQSKDYSDYLKKSQAFFETASPMDNEQIIMLLRDPQRESLEYEETNNRTGFSGLAHEPPHARAQDLEPIATEKAILHRPRRP